MTTVSPQDLTGIVAATWCEVLGLEALPREANFFAIGGDSLTAVIVAAELRERLGGEVSLSDLLDAPAFGDFVARVAEVVPEAAE
jgi:acyl carrier protein